MSDSEAGPPQVARASVHLPELDSADFVVETAERDLAWAAMPEAMMMLRASGVGGNRTAELAAVGRAFVSSSGPTLTRCGPLLLISTSVQTSRVFTSMMPFLSARFGPSSVVRFPRLTPRSAALAWRSARRLGRDLDRAFDAVGTAAPDGLVGELLKTEVARRRCDAARLDTLGVRAVVVASQQNSSTRAILSSVHARSGICTMYVPHAPTADNVFYRDIPTHCAFLRGTAEVEYYGSFSRTQTDQITVVGNPVSLPVEPVGAGVDNHVLFAPSPHSLDILRADIEVIHLATDQPIRVAPHPRMTSGSYRAMFPGTWSIGEPGNTASAIQRGGVLAMVQHGSGVGLEALSLGVEVIDLCNRAEQPNYPYIREPEVQIASDADELRSAFQKLGDRAAGEDARIEYARTWCADSGPAAATSLVREIESVLDHPRPAALVLDGWSSLLHSQ